MTRPQIVDRRQWETALERLRAREKELTLAHDALAAERRRLPWVRIEKDYVFQGADGSARLVDLFDGRRQLLLYHFMFGPSQTAGCEGCSMFVDQVGHLAHLHARDTSFVLVSRAPIAALETYRKRMGWSIPWYSSFGTSFNPDFGRGPETPQPDRHQDGEMFGLSAFIRDGDAVYRTYFTSNRGVEALGPVWTFLDLTALGRQEEWEDSPAGIPRTPPYGWWRRHDEYGGSERKQGAVIAARRNAKVFPHLWYAKEAEEAARFYASIFPDSRVDRVTPLLSDSPSGPAGSVKVVDFTLLGQRFQAISAGPHHEFNDAISMVVVCDDQAELDRYWNALLQGGKAQACGWLIDRFGLRWQIVPAILDDLMRDEDAARSKRVTDAMLGMIKLDIAALEKAYR